MYRLSLLAVTLSATLFANPAAAAPPDIAEIGTDLLALGVSDDGQSVVGLSLVAGKEDVFRWTPRTQLQHIGGIVWGLPDISSDGSIVAGTIRTDRNEAAFWTESKGWKSIVQTDLIPPFAGWATFSNAISSDGRRLAGGTEPPPGVLRAFSFNPDVDAPLADFGFQELPRIHKGTFPEATDTSNDGRIQVGLTQDVSGIHRAIRWKDGVAELLADGEGRPLGGELVRCDSNCRTIVGGGGGSSAEKPVLAWRLKADSRQPACYLNPLSGPKPFALRYYAHDVSESGDIVAGTFYYVDAEWRQHARGFLWIGDDHGGTMHDLQKYLADQGQPYLDGWEWVVVTSMSGDGRYLVGWGFDATDQLRAFRIDFGSVPLPRGSRLDYTRCPATGGSTQTVAAQAQAGWDQPGGDFRSSDGRSYLIRPHGRTLLGGTTVDRLNALVHLGGDAYYDPSSHTRLIFTRERDGSIRAMQGKNRSGTSSTWKKVTE